MDVNIYFNKMEYRLMKTKIEFGKSVSESVRGSVSILVWGSMDSSVWRSLDRSVWYSVSDSVWEAFNNSMRWNIEL